MKTKHIAAAALLAFAGIAHAHATGHVAHLTETFYSGAVFDGMVTFNDGFDTITAIDGLVSGGGASSPGGLDYNTRINSIFSASAVMPGVGRAELLDGPLMTSTVSMLFTWNYGAAPTLAFSDAGHAGSGSGNYLQPFWAPNANYVDRAISGSINLLAGDVTAVPEPATYGMLAGGLALLALVARRKAAPRTM